MIDQSSAQFQDKIKIANEETDKFRKLSRKLETDISFYKENIVKSELNQHEQLSEVKTQIEEYQREVTGLNSKIQTLEELLISKDDQIKNNEVVVLRLNQNIRVLENQVQQNESRSKEFEKQLSDSYEKIKEIRNENEQLETSNQAFKNTTDNYEKKVVELIKSITKLENERKDEKKNASDKISQQQKLIDDNAEAITRMNTEIMNLQNYQFELLSNNGNLNDELNKSKLEIERLHSIIGAQNTSNFSLSQQLEDANVRIRELVSDNEELTNKISSVESYTRVQIFKLESTISQQSKLINFLQADSQKKKGSKLKFKSPDISNTSVLMPPARKDRDLEKLLDIERNNSLKLNSELMRLKEKLKLLDDHKRDTGLLQETLSHVNRDSDTSIANSLVESVSTKEHVLNNLVCFHPNSCFICLRPISYGHTIVQCSNCKIFFHSNCQSGLPCFNCTVVPGLVNIDFLYDFRDLNKLFTSLDSFKPHPPYVGYLSIPNIIAHNKYDWRKHTVEVTETHIYIKNEAEDHVEETGMINFKAMKDPCIVRPAIHTSDVLFTPPVNVPLVFGIEISSTESSHFSFQSNSICHESQSPPTQQNTILFLMAQSLEEKRMWVRLLNELFSVSAINCRLNYPPVCTLNTSEHQVITNVCPVNDEALLIGHSRGISVYDLHENKFTINSEIIEIHSLFRVGMHLFAIVNKNRQLARVESGKKSKPYFSVLAKKKNQIVFSSIKECDNCVDIHFGTMKGDHIYLYVSKPGQLMCLRIPPDGTHCMSLSIETGDIPVSSVAAYEGTVVVRQDKFFFYNFKDRTKKEFLDPTDHSLAFIVYGSSANSNYPMSVFLINKDEIPEFLICCSEFGIIVDKDGRHMSDGPIRWDQIPLSFHYHYKCLIVCCPDKIEIWHIPSSAVYNANESTQPTSFNFKCPSILAQTSSQEKDIYVSEVNHDFSLSIYRVPLRKVVSKRIHSICSQEAPDLGGGGKHVEHSPSHPTPLKYKRSSIMKLLKK
ncbi:Citron Rho-interacting kinase [Thelohanellus kitauei]|uniref:Citron Rho-interacting kinase n=1 Tax=Thelohanellus kitauei TaxID=669202 RepID=A0A0C2I8V2_THEKT|nr:Citron Rho-interacting kinase [Thelohanellus kitauei]